MLTALSLLATGVEPAHATPSFTDVAREAGVGFVHHTGAAGRWHYPEIMGAGVILFDYDNDGDPDLYFLNGNALSAPDPAITNVLYRNDSKPGALRFTDVTAEAGVGDSGYGQGGEAADFDADGDLDLYVSNLGTDVLFRNEGGGRFARMPMPNSEAWGQNCAALDFDRDGDLDLYVSNYLTYDAKSEPVGSRLIDGKKTNDYRGPQKYAGSASKLWRNDGELRFTDVTKATGLLRPTGKGMGLACVDFDGDGATDIFEANDSLENFLFVNAGGRFEEKGLIAGCAVSRSGAAEASMGVDVGDADGDGRPDLIVPCLEREVHTLYRNEWPWFNDISVKARLHLATRNSTGFSPNLADFDNDGDLDLFISCGRVRMWENEAALAPGADLAARYGEQQLLLENDGGGRFTKVPPDAAGAYFTTQRVGRGSAVGDLDGDGRIDLVVCHAGAAPAILSNQTATPGNWLSLKLEGPAGNRDAIGARVVATVAGREFHRWVRGGGSYLSVGDRRVHFGLGTASEIERLEITWPSGETRVLEALKPGRFHNLAP